MNNNIKTVTTRGNRYAICVFWKANRSIQNQVVYKYAASLVKSGDREFPFSSPIVIAKLIKIQTRLNIDIYTGPGWELYFLRISQFKMVSYRRKPFHVVKINTVRASIVTEKGRLAMLQLSGSLLVSEIRAQSGIHKAHSCRNTP